MTALPSVPAGTEEPLTLPAGCRRVVVACSAGPRSAGVRRLPDRQDGPEPVPAYQVGTASDAEALLVALDRPGLEVLVDAEAKQPVDLVALARRRLQQARLATIKPNDVTVDAVEALLLDQFGPDLSGLPVAVHGTGNLGFKIALRLAERQAWVELFGRRADRVAAATEAINAVLPRFSRHRLTVAQLDCFRAVVSAVSAPGTLGVEWLSRLTRDALVVDVGINNLTEDLIAAAGQRGVVCVRLDVRAAPHPLPPERNPFFDRVWGRGRIAGVAVVAGGVIGAPGEVVVDCYPTPTRVVGVADGSGGLVPPDRWTAADRREVQSVAAALDPARP